MSATKSDVTATTNCSINESVCNSATTTTATNGKQHHESNNHNHIKPASVLCQEPNENCGTKATHDAIASTNNAAAASPTVNLPHMVLNRLFTTFYVNQRREALKWFLSAYLCFSIYTIALPFELSMEHRGKFASGQLCT